MSRLETPQIYDDLRNKLIETGFRPGEKLKPQEIQALYGCSANTIRDVLFRLATEGLADFVDQKGFRVPKMSVRKQHELTQMRILLEAEGTCMSMRTGSVDWEAKLSAVHHKLLHLEKRIRASGNSGELLALWLRAEEEFHQTLISACGSPLHIETFGRVYLQFRQQNVAQQRDFGSNAFSTILTEHQAIVDAALARDQDACRVAIFEHLKRNILPPDGTAVEET